MGSSHSEDHSCISGTGRRILYDGATREALKHLFVSSFPHMYLGREARFERLGRWGSSATVLAVPSKALGPLANPSASLELFPPLRNAVLLDCSPPSSSVPGISEARILEGVPLPSLQGSIWKIIFSWIVVLDEGRGILPGLENGFLSDTCKQIV